mgnify:CR=1 FL=1
MNDILINALVARIKKDEMKIEQVPIPYREKVQEKLDSAT